MRKTKKSRFSVAAVLTGTLLAFSVAPGLSAQAAGRASEGLTVVKSKGCLSCHTTNGQPLVGPSWKGIYGKKATVMVKGRPEVKTVNERYLEFMIEHPGVWIVKGYTPDMPQLPLTGRQVDAIIAYIKTLK